ncbi:hypothetical protein OsI_25473 [Oryza sativa Indica Group]|uniref:Uncharacterized protein n=1 Tax=Oryza sativa subsp. indica TaxID=39946 RepID=A2YJS0_ORYSI|nr:hypothetical protein OsI_25473 [Oryza sativa Indica Group]
MAHLELLLERRHGNANMPKWPASKRSYVTFTPLPCAVACSGDSTRREETAAFLFIVVNPQCSFH